MPCKVIAHRGASGHAPENTLAAFRKGIEMADGIELDVQPTKDGVLVVCHDHTVDRTTNGRGLLVDYTFAELRELSAGIRFSPDYESERIPTLKEVLDVCPDGFFVNVEIKNGPIRYPGIERGVVEAIHQYGKRLNIVVSSFDHTSLLEVQRLDPSIPKGLLYEGGFVRIWDYVKAVGLSVQTLNPHADYAQPEFVEDAHTHGYAVFPWVLNTEMDLRMGLQANIDGVFTNYPDRANKIIREQAQ